ncbi:TIGR02757 family protein [Draconibacterium sp. IB214405]|uniref:TIGR02757 family protein n=1 Tax=Draconibacterium sp. IB214405 TaxID=3097352 RepID=UPI002A0D85F3|nr:TIGR02757 family protein [Draconibacterium sp. IB214405]MDX8341568.1 TIGR02757 family protein [Draconibacterium sp. IB214405]
MVIDLKEYLEEKVKQYNTPEFIGLDPIQIPHLYSLKEDIEISGFLAATIAWGNRKMIIRNAKRMMELMGNSPFDFIVNHEERHLKKIDGFVHRTFNNTDFLTYIEALKRLYKNMDGLQGIFNRCKTEDSLQPAIHQFKNEFFNIPHLQRTEKHLPDPYKGSAAKKINMFLRWMIRNDDAGVDFGLWKDISPSILSCPLDVHTGRVARKLGLLNRKQDDAKAVTELDKNLRMLDIDDPVKYDFALFGIGVHEVI